jgi:hypothetical protein
MADDPLANAVETFSSPIEHLIAALGQGIAQAQRALDQNSIQTQELIDTDPLLSQYGLQATWYQFPKVDLELKLSLAISADQSSTPPGPAPPPAAPGPAPAPLAISTAALQSIRLIAQPVSAAYQTHFNYDAHAASTLTLSIVPVPQPGPSDRVTAPPRMTAFPGPTGQPDVQGAALASAAKFVTTTDSKGNKIPAAQDTQHNALRFDVNFNATARLWYVLQYAPSNAAVKPVVVAVDDATASVRIISTP